MENTQTQNPQAAQAQAQQQMLQDIMNHAGLDVKNMEHQKATIEAVEKISELEEKGLEKERKGIMREFGLQPDEFEQSIQGMQKFAQTQLQEIDQKATAARTNLEQEANAKIDAVNTKLNKGRTAQLISMVVGGAISTYFSYNKFIKGKEDSNWKDKGIVAGIVAASMFVTNLVTGLFTTKGAMKEHEELKASLPKQAAEMEAQIQEAKTLTIESGQSQIQQAQYEMFVELAARMAKERVEAAHKKTEAPAVKAPQEVHAPAAHVPPVSHTAEHPSAPQTHAAKAGHKPPVTQEILNREAPATSPQTIQAQKEAAASGVSQVGG